MPGREIWVKCTRGLDLVSLGAYPRPTEMTLDDFLRAFEALVEDREASDDPGEGNYSCEDCRACNNCRFCVGCDTCEDCTYCEESLDCTSCTQSKRCVSCKKVSYCEDSRECRESRYLTLCVNCTDCVHCLACVGLDGGEFYVLNQKRPRKEYFALLRQVQELMLARMDGGWRPEGIGLASDVFDPLAAGRDTELSTAPWLVEIIEPARRSPSYDDELESEVTRQRPVIRDVEPDTPRPQLRPPERPGQGRPSSESGVEHDDRDDRGGFGRPRESGAREHGSYARDTSWGARGHAGRTPPEREMPRAREPGRAQGVYPSEDSRGFGRPAPSGPQRRPPARPSAEPRHERESYGGEAGSYSRGTDSYGREPDRYAGGAAARGQGRGTAREPIDDLDWVSEPPAFGSSYTSGDEREDQDVHARRARPDYGRDLGQELDPDAEWAREPSRPISLGPDPAAGRGPARGYEAPAPSRPRRRQEESESSYDHERSEGGRARRGGFHDDSYGYGAGTDAPSARAKEQPTQPFTRSEARGFPAREVEAPPAPPVPAVEPSARIDPPLPPRVESPRVEPPRVAGSASRVAPPSAPSAAKELAPLTSTSLGDEDAPGPRGQEPSSPWLDEPTQARRAGGRGSLRRAGRPKRPDSSGAREGTGTGSESFRASEGTHTGLRLGRKPKKR